MRKSAILILISLLWALRASAQEQSLTLMQSRTGLLGADFPTETWDYAPGETDSTVLVETISGSLDPALELLDSDGELIARSEDFAPAFSTAARLSVPAGGPYRLRVSAAFGEGDYHITALPGAMHRQWNDSLSVDNPFWHIERASPTPDGFLLETSIGTTRLFSPLGAFHQQDVYIQADFHFQTVRPDTVAGLMLRGTTEANGQVTGFRFEVAPAGDWSLRINDVAGSDSMLSSGTLHAVDDGVTLGMLAQGARVAMYADGALLTEVEQSAPGGDGDWGVTVFDGSVILHSFWVATPAEPAPAFPTNLENWNGSPNAIAAELFERGLMAEAGVQMLGVPMTAYTVSGAEQRNFLITEDNQHYDNLVMGGDVRLVAGADVGCGLLAQFTGRENRVLAYVDNHAGGGLLWWKDGHLQSNNYALTEPSQSSDDRLLLIMQGHFATLYINGRLTAQEIIPRRGGNVGVGFVNFEQDMASCEFRNVWVWG
jgi:hypothetical protein